MFSKFDILPKDMNNIKKKFNQIMFNNDIEKYHEWVEQNDLESILKEFEQKCGLKEKL